MTNTTLTWIGIVSQAIPSITAILMVTVGNWLIKRKERIKYIKHKRDLCLNFDYETAYIFGDISHWMPLTPPNQSKQVYQYSTTQEPNVWHDATEHDFHVGKHLTKFVWRIIER